MTARARDEFPESRITGAHGTVLGGVKDTSWQRRATFDDEGPSVIGTAERQICRESYRFYAGTSLQLFEQPPLERGDLMVIRIAGSRQRQARRQDALGPKTWRHMDQLHKTPDHETSANQQDQCDCDLCHCQPVSQKRLAAACDSMAGLQPSCLNARKPLIPANSSHSVMLGEIPADRPGNPLRAGRNWPDKSPRVELYFVARDVERWRDCPLLISQCN
jgi:hypothetical protein